MDDQPNPIADQPAPAIEERETAKRTRDEPPIGSVEICQDGRPAFRTKRGWEYPAKDQSVDVYEWARLQRVFGPTQPMTLASRCDCACHSCCVPLDASCDMCKEDHGQVNVDA